MSSISSGGITLVQEFSDLRWDPTNKHQDITLLNSGTTAKLRSVEGATKAVYANKGYVIGTDTDVITMTIHNGPLIHIGLVEDGKTYAESTTGSTLTKLYVGVANDIMTLTLTTTKLTIAQGTKQTSFLLTNFIGKTMYPWLSDSTDSASGFAVTIKRSVEVTISINSSGYVVFGSSESGGEIQGMKFESGPVEFNSGVVVSTINHDVIESAISTLTLKSSGGVGVTINDIGAITAPEIITPSVTSTGQMDIKTSGSMWLNATGGDVVITSNNMGLTITETGNVVVDNNITTETLAVGSVPTDGGIVFAISDDGGNKAMLLPRTSSRSGITPTQVGMFVYDTTDASVFVHDGSDWVSIATGTTQSTVVSSGDVGTFQIDLTHDIIMANHSSSTQEIVLPDPDITTAGKAYSIMNYSDYTVTLRTVSNVMEFDGGSGLLQIFMLSKYDSVNVVSTGVHWFTR